MESGLAKHFEDELQRQYEAMLESRGVAAPLFAPGDMSDGRLVVKTQIYEWIGSEATGDGDWKPRGGGEHHIAEGPVSILQRDAKSLVEKWDRQLNGNGVPPENPKLRQCYEVVEWYGVWRRSDRTDREQLLLNMVNAGHIADCDRKKYLEILHDEPRLVQSRLRRRAEAAAARRLVNGWATHAAVSKSARLRSHVGRCAMRMIAKGSTLVGFRDLAADADPDSEYVVASGQLAFARKAVKVTLAEQYHQVNQVCGNTEATEVEQQRYTVGEYLADALHDMEDIVGTDARQQVAYLSYAMRQVIERPGTFRGV